MTQSPSLPSILLFSQINLNHPIVVWVHSSFALLRHTYNDMDPHQFPVIFFRVDHDIIGSVLITFRYSITFGWSFDNTIHSRDPSDIILNNTKYSTPH
eukprot:293115_1